jgi:hypothetical protein
MTCNLASEVNVIEENENTWLRLKIKGVLEEAVVILQFVNPRNTMCSIQGISAVAGNANGSITGA